MPSRPLLQTSVVIAIVATVACGGSPATDQATNGERAPAPNTAASEPASVPTAKIPDDPCGWVPATDIEAVVGRLGGSPAPHEGGCRYPLPQNPETIAMRESARRVEGPQSITAQATAADAIVVHVDVGGSVTDERAVGAAADVLAKEFLGAKDGANQPPKSTTPAGWDYASTTVSAYPSFWGRSGQVRVTVTSQTPHITNEQAAAVAARVRDRIPDLPFPATNLYQIPTFGANGNPCDLVTREEAETVLGKLTVTPYRSSEHSPLRHPKGKACSYYTAGHHALIMTPLWSNGREDFQMESFLGGLLSRVAPQESAALEGPWERARISTTTGALLFLKGDRLLRVDYLTSSTDRAGAVELARRAMQRLAGN